MSVLTQKLQEASKLFQSHDFKKSLDAYEDCIDFCNKTKEDQSVISNILSAKATLEYILGDYDKAMVTLNSVLSKDPVHFLCLLRRSQVYKKKNKLKKALKDLQKIYVYCPDNLQISAFKSQVQHMILAQGSQLNESSDESDSQNQEYKINFMNLKLIDRKSSDMSGTKHDRKSRVTILGDTTVQYNKEEDNVETGTDDEQNVSDKALRTYRQIQMDFNSQPGSQAMQVKISAPKGAKKSILKNKGTSIFIRSENEQEKQSKYLGRESKLITLLKSIDGRLIHSGEFQHEADKEVMFRKSNNQFAILDVLQRSPQLITSCRSANEGNLRRSCLKRPSFQLGKDTRPHRRSRFEQIDAAKIDGKLLAPRKRRSIDDFGGSIGQQDIKAENSDSDNEASSHNIFGSRGVEMTRDLREKLGLTETPEVDESQHMWKSANLSKKVSILKKNSSVFSNMKKSSFRQEKKEGEELPVQSGHKLKSKKSVVFTSVL